ncbi:SpoIIE family protein phosphatase [soil metagenome]
MPSTPFEHAESGDILIVEDDPADALLAREYLEEEAVGAYSTTWARTLQEALASLSAETTCVLLDLGLPDSQGTGALEAITRAAPAVPIVVLTGLGDRSAGMRAVAAGAQDYLVKGDVTPTALLRSVRYAVERRRNEEQGLRLLHAESRREENTRLARGLLPVPALRDAHLTASRRYQPGGGDALLGGDFFDAVELADGTVRLVIGDVCGHGPDEAALGVSLRIAWRTLVLTGHEEHLFSSLETVLDIERDLASTYATLCDVTIASDRRSATVRLAGHPPPIAIGDDGKVSFASCPPRTPLGIDGLDPNATTPAGQVALSGDWSMLLYTDGIYEGRRSAVGNRVDLEGLSELLTDLVARGERSRDLLDQMVDQVEAWHGGALEDDVALLLLEHRTS